MRTSKFHMAGSRGIIENYSQYFVDIGSARDTINDRRCLHCPLPGNRTFQNLLPHWHKEVSACHFNLNGSQHFQRARTAENSLPFPSTLKCTGKKRAFHISQRDASPATIYTRRGDFRQIPKWKPLPRIHSHPSPPTSPLATSLQEDLPSAMIGRGLFRYRKILYNQWYYVCRSDAFPKVPEVARGV